MSFPELMSDYDAIHFLDHVVEYPGRFKEITNEDGTIDHEPAEGDIIQAGTPLSAFYLGRMDHGIWTLFQLMRDLKDDMLNLVLIVGALKGSIVNNMGSNIFFVEILDPEVEIIEGWIDEVNSRVVVI